MAVGVSAERYLIKLTKEIATVFKEMKINLNKKEL